MAQWLGCSSATRPIRDWLNPAPSTNLGAGEDLLNTLKGVGQCGSVVVETFLKVLETLSFQAVETKGVLRKRKKQRVELDFDPIH